jgi:hypothetical protein
LGVIAWTLWAYPALLDAVRYGDLPRGCWDGAFSYRGDADGVSLSGRHCMAGATYSGNESGYLLHMELARDGRLLLYGRRDIYTDRGRASPIQFALLRTPGDDGQWLCADAGTYTPRADNFMQGALHLTGVRPLRPATPEPDGALTTLPTAADPLGLGPPLQGRVHTLTLDGGRTWGFSCDPNTTRCDLSLGYEGALWRLFARAQAPMRAASPDAPPAPLAYAFLAIEDARAPTRVIIAEALQPSHLRIASDSQGDLNHLSLQGLRALTPCPSLAPSGAQGGVLDVRWSRD